MIIAHGPLGYLLAVCTQRWWQGRLPHSRSYLWKLYGAAALGGIFPDVDLFYYYFVNASVSHRQLLTHSFVTYTTLLLIVLLFGYWKKTWRPVLAIAIAFIVGCFSHICADMLVGMAAAVAPVSSELYGLVSIPWYRQSIFMQYSFATNFTAEFIIIVFAIGTIIRKRWWWLVGGISSLLMLGLFIWISQHVYKPNGYYYYSDDDQDGLLNYADRDSDGDGLMNMIDEDINQDGTDNALAMYLELFAAEGSLFDYSFGHLIEVPLRVGFVNDRVLINRLYANVGIFFAAEMSHDYAIRPGDYVSTPLAAGFSETPDNWLAWLEHTNHLLPGDTSPQEFDIIFFQSGKVALFTRTTAGEDVVLDVDASHLYTQYLPLSQVSAAEGGIKAIGRPLPKPFAKRY